MQTFHGGTIYFSPATGAHAVHGLILARYQALGGPSSLAGFPTSDEQTVTGGRASTFTGATIYWSPGTGAHEVHGLIRDHYQALGGPSSLAGLPTSDEQTVTGGRASTFTGAAIYWSPGTGAHEVHGAIGSAYLSHGGPGSPLALPTSDEQPVTGGRQNTFQHGSITWNAASGATTVSQR